MVEAETCFFERALTRTGDCFSSTHFSPFMLTDTNYITEKTHEAERGKNRRFCPKPLEVDEGETGC